MLSQKSTGGICKLIDKTPFKEESLTRKRRYSHGSFDSTINIFSKDYHRGITPLNISAKRKISPDVFRSGEYAGITTKFDVNNYTIKLIGNKQQEK